jgi:ABC-type multidrug transport system fused ATPase/permease subunit
LLITATAFYDIDSGEILIDGKYLWFRIRESSWQYEYSSQDVILFGGTIKENIAYGKPDATEEETLAAKQANAFNFIEGFPEKFETIVGERGIKLSGGQRQRIALPERYLKIQVYWFLMKLHLHLTVKVKGSGSFRDFDARKNKYHYCPSPINHS